MRIEAKQLSICDATIKDIEYVKNAYQGMVDGMEKNKGQYDDSIYTTEEF